MRLPDRPDVALYDVGRVERTVPEASLGLAPGDPRVRRFSSDASRRALRFHPLKRRRCADLALGGVDVFHHASRVLPPIARAAQTLAVAEFPGLGSSEEGLLERALSRAQGVLVFSSSSARRLAVHFGVPPDRVHRVAVGCDHWRRDHFPPPEREEIPRILALGSLHAGRRTLRLLKAFEMLVELGLNAHLHFVGGSGAEEKEFERVLESSPVRLRIVRERWLPERDLAALVARSSVLVHLVEDSETPVTPLEAFSFGTPVVASRMPAFEESLGELAELLLNADVDRSCDCLVDAIERAIKSSRDEAACARRIRHAEQYSWERNARETVAAWEAVLRKSAPTSSPR